MKHKAGFALMEVLIVVLIIGILAAVALPQYQIAVLKSRFAALMPIAKAMADSNEVYYMEHGSYGTSPTDLDITGQGNYPEGITVNIHPNSTETGNEDYNYVIASRSQDFPMNYIIYQNHSPAFAGNIHCEADEHNTMAQQVCQSLGGVYMDGSQSDGYLTYILKGNASDGQFVSGIEKVAAQLCGGRTGCTYTVNGNTISTQECGDSVSYQQGNTTKTGIGCVRGEYNEKGVLQSSATAVCNNTYASLDETTQTCMPFKTSESSMTSFNWETPFETSYDEEGNMIGKKVCLTLSANNGCRWMKVFDNEYENVPGYGNQGIYYDTTCSEWKDQVCTRYSSMTKMPLGTNNTQQECLSISGTTCTRWGSWSAPMAA